MFDESIKSSLRIDNGNCGLFVFSECFSSDYMQEIGIVKLGHIKMDDFKT